MPTVFKLKQFLIIVLLVSIWVNASEVFRYFLIVMPQTRAFLAMVPDVAPMNWAVFAVWGAWDMLLTTAVVFISWLAFQAFGNNIRSVIIAGTLTWATLFLLFWVALWNMSLAQPKLALTALPLAWLEMIIAAYLTSKLYGRQSMSKI